MAGAVIQFRFEDSEIRKLMASMDPTPTLHDFGNYMVRRVTKVFQRGGAFTPSGEVTRSQPGAPPFTRSGQRGLVGSITYDLAGRRLQVGTNKIYGRILQFGGEIFPVRAKALSVPIHKDAKKVASPREIPGLTLIPRKGKPALLVRIRKKVWDIMFVLVPKVTIEPHPYLEWLKTDADYLLMRLQRQFDGAA